MSKELADILLPSETWRNPLFPLEDRLAICEGAVAYERTLRKKFEKERDEAIAALRSEPEGAELAINPTGEAADAFWRYWKANGETHKHGYYESTWGAINAALRVAGVCKHVYAAPSREDRRESNSNPAPDVGQSKTGLTGSHPGAPTPSRTDRQEPGLSAEDIEYWSSGPWTFIPNCDESVLTFTSAEWEPIKQQLLRSLTARDEGIEAAAKVCDSLNFSINIDSWGAMTKHEISVLTCNECAIAIRALSQGQRCSTCDGTGDIHRADGEFLGKCDHPTEQDADELLREVFAFLSDSAHGKWRYVESGQQASDMTAWCKKIRAHLSRKEQ